MVLVDIHAHILPNIDDGSPTLAASLDLARAAVADGITHALMTPHHLNGRYVNHKQDVIKLTDEFQAKLKEEEIPLTVFPSQEVRLSSDIPEALEEDDILFCDEEGKYMLLEMPSEDVPLYAKDMTYRLLGMGITPIIVHPERNAKILDHPEVLQEFLEQGCLTQVTASSYIGVFGKRVADFSERLVAAGQVATFASDVHTLTKRESKMTAAYEKLAKQMDPETVKQYQDAAQSIVNGENISLDWQPFRRKKRFWIF